MIMKRKHDQKIDGYIFPSSITNKMKKSINKTYETNKERGFSLCVDEDTNEVHAGKEHVQKGNSASIKFEAGCKRKNQRHAGTFHTHINTDSSEASAMDIYNNCLEYNKIDCIGSAKDGKIVCMTKINPSNNCQNKVNRLVNSEDILLMTNQGDEQSLYSELDKVIKENFKLSELKY